MKISGYRLLGPVSRGLFGLFNGVIWFIVGLVVSTDGIIIVILCSLLLLPNDQLFNCHYGFVTFSIDIIRHERNLKCFFKIQFFFTIINCPSYNRRPCSLAFFYIKPIIKQKLQ